MLFKTLSNEFNVKPSMPCTTLKISGTQDPAQSLWVIRIRSAGGFTTGHGSGQKTQKVSKVGRRRFVTWIGTQSH